MGLAMEVITGFATAPGTTTTALTAASGNTFTIRNASLESRIWLIGAWADFQAAGFLQVRSPRLHDNVRGIRLDVVASEVKPLLPNRYKQMLTPQDALVAEIQGSATAGDIETASLLVVYEDLPGVQARFISAEECYDRTANVVTVENTISTGTAGGYSGEEAITAESDLLKANTDYAVLGYLVDVECATIRFRSADSGNLGIGGPGDELGRDYTRSWFLDLARLYNMALVPVFNSANKGNVLVDAAQDENGADVALTLILAELTPQGRR